ncbi:MAG TPA: protein translocase subunit SecF [Gemmatimonadaceae bacterium]|nr:protein translocase subunit SecF [Gemmatimonadaceae bacterium]
MLRILHNTKYDFIRHWRLTTGLIAAFIVPALVWIAVQGFNYSIEFTGGTLMQVEFRQAPDMGKLRSVLTDAGISNLEIQTFGRPEEIVLRGQEESHVEQQEEGAEAIVTTIRGALDREYGRDAYNVVRTEAVGPKVGSELRTNAVIALLISFAITLVYLAWRFEWRFAVAALVATIHDIIATVAFMRYANVEVSLFVVGAILTVVGYSLNDTIVVFDRVRENLKAAGRDKSESFVALLNRSVNETLPRTVMTGTTTLATLIALFIFGGEVIRPFAVVLIFGILVGTFSSVFVASPVLLWIERRWPAANVTRATRVTAAEPRRRPA